MASRNTKYYTGKRKKIQCKAMNNMILVNNKLDMKDPYIQKRTLLNIKQAKLMSCLVKNKMSKDRFVYILNNIGRTKNREKIIKLLNRAKIIKSNQKANRKGSEQSILIFLICFM